MVEGKSTVIPTSQRAPGRPGAVGKVKGEQRNELIGRQSPSAWRKPVELFHDGIPSLRSRQLGPFVSKCGWQSER